MLLAVVLSAVVTCRAAPSVMPLLDMLGLVLTVDVCAPDPLPLFHASVKDGYTVVATDGPGEYPVNAEARAAEPAPSRTSRPEGRFLMARMPSCRWRTRSRSQPRRMG